MTSHYSHSVSIHRRLHCFSNRLLRHISMKTSKLHVLALVKAIQRTSKTKSVYMWWRHHVEEIISSNNCHQDDIPYCLFGYISGAVLLIRLHCRRCKLQSGPGGMTTADFDIMYIDLQRRWDFNNSDRTGRNYRKNSSISRTKPQSLNVSCFLAQLSSLNPLKPAVKLRMKM